MNNQIFFFNEEINFVPRKKKLIRLWLLNAIKHEGKHAGDLNFIFCNDDYLYKLNNKYLKHRTLTDIITFPHEDNVDRISGDIFISIERVRENAKKFHQLTETELKRVMIHGVLHLIGFKDSTPDEKLLMRKKEDFYLSIDIR